MKRFLRWAGMALGGLLGLAFIAYAVVYVLSERAFKHPFKPPAVAIQIPTDSASIIEGQRLATTRGCFAGCHGKQAEGLLMFNQPLIARIGASNLTASVRKYSDSELATMIQSGVRPDGRAMVVMPSEVFVGLTVEDLGRIIAFLKSLPAVDGPDQSVSLGPIGRIGVAIGQFKLPAQAILETVSPPEAKSEQAALGRYLARTSCAQCHGTGLRGDSNPDFAAPSLRAVAAYSPEAFRELMRTGAALGGRKLGAMRAWAKNNLSKLTDSEIAALYSYLHEAPL